MTYYSKNFRGTTATRDYKVGDEVVFIPRKNLVMLETCFNTPIGKAMYDFGLFNRCKYNTHCFLAIWVLENQHDPNSFFKTYLANLPKDFDEYPINYSDEDL